MIATAFPDCSDQNWIFANHRDQNVAFPTGATERKVTATGATEEKLTAIGEKLLEKKVSKTKTQLKQLTEALFFKPKTELKKMRQRCVCVFLETNFSIRLRLF